jgi:hypothetical protein
VPPDGCGAGFEHDGDRGCEPILPAEPCPIGLMAVPGDASCREIAPCGNPPWGNIAVEPNTQFVDGSYTGTDSDGSVDKPWTTVQAGVDAAAQQAIVAVAAGNYVESVEIEGKAVRLWGRCPALVEISATGGYGAVFVSSGASGTEVRGLALIGSATGAGLLVSNAQEVVADALWIHDSPSFGVSTEAFPNDTSLTLGGSLIEHNRDVGVFVWSSSSTLVVEASVVRDTLPIQGTFGRGISLECTPSLGCDASVTSHASVRGSLIEGNRDIGINVSGAEAEIIETVVRGTLPADNGIGGWGVQVQVPCLPGMCDASAPARATLRQSLIAENHATGVAIGGSEAHLDATVVRGTLPDEQGHPGRGVTVYNCSPQAGCTFVAPGVATLSWSLIQDNRDVGLIVAGSQVEIVASAVRGTLVNAIGQDGLGISIQPICEGACDPTTPSRAEIRSSLFEANHTAGVSVAGSELTLEASVVRGTLGDDQGNWGRGLEIRAPCAMAGCLTEMPAHATLTNVLIEDNVDSGVAIANAQATLQSCVIRRTLADANARFGDGLAVYSELAPASASVTATIVESSARGALSAFGATLSYAGTALRDQSFDLIGERIGQSAYVIENLGGNCCDCPTANDECVVESAGFEPPAPLTGVPAGP